MSYQDRNHFPGSQWESDEGEDNARPAVSPGKRTLTMGLPPRSARLSAVQTPVQQKADPAAVLQRSEQAARSSHWMNVAVRPDVHGAPVQHRSDEGASSSPQGGDDSVSIHHTAESGVQGGGGALPHLDTIQKSFGQHDVSGIDAHVGGAAQTASEALGARAYATGHSVAFKDSPDLHTAAHEAAHIVQQRQGVSLKGGVGQSGDQYEQHADAVADQVVRGESAEDMLSRGPGGGSGSAGVQYLQFSGHDQHGQAVQFDGPGGGQLPTGQATPAQDQDQGVGFQAGEYTQVQLQARIPTPIAGLTINVTLTGKYTAGNERGADFIEAEGVARVALSYQLLFLNLSVFLQGGLKFKVRNTTDWQAAFDAAFEDISHWVAARELANLPAKKQDVAARYTEFRNAVFLQIGTIRRQSGSERYEQLRRENRPLLWFNNALANIVDARNSLVNNVTNIFSDMDGSINGNEIYPGTDWINQQIQSHLADHDVSGEELNVIRDALLGESDRRKSQVTTAMDSIPALSNNANVEFEGNLQVGASAGIAITQNTSAQIELARGWRISDSMGAQQFDTSVQDVYTAAIQASGRVGTTNVQGQLAYEGIGSSPTEPTEFKITGQIMAGLNAQAEDPSAYSSNLQGVKDRVCRALSGARVGGQSALTAVNTALQREMSANSAARWSATGSFMAGFDAEFKFRAAASGGGYEAAGGQLKFVMVRSVGGSMGVFSGSVERGNYIGIQW
jgi:hypothetical protein